MAGFLAAAAMLCLVLVALALRPLWRGARGTAAILSVALLAGTAGVYALLGAPGALDPAQVKPPETLDQAIAQLEARLAGEPGSVEGWVLLGRSRAAQDRWPEAAEAFARAQALLPEEPDLMVELADARMRAAAGGRFPADAVSLLERAVELRPDHQRALFYLGAQRLQAGQPAEAAAYWDRLLPLVDAATAEALRPQLALAREQAGLPPLEPVAAAAADGPRLKLRVELDQSLAGSIPDTAVLYVFARTTDGAGLPVAVKRLPAAGFPLQVELSDADGLMPAQRLSAQSRVRLLARISLSGDAAAAAGDLEATPVVREVAEGAEATLVIDKVVE